MIDEKYNNFNGESGKTLSNDYSWSTFLIVNILIVTGFNLIYFLLLGKYLYKPWGDIGYVVTGVPILIVIELIGNIYLRSKKKATILSIIIALFLSIFIFVGITSGLVNSNFIRHLMQ